MRRLVVDLGVNAREPTLHPVPAEREVAGLDTITGVADLETAALMQTVPPRRLSKYPVEADTREASTAETPIELQLTTPAVRIPETCPDVALRTPTLAVAVTSSIPLKEPLLATRLEVVSEVAVKLVIEAAAAVKAVVILTLATVKFVATKLATEPFLYIGKVTGSTEVPVEYTRIAVDEGILTPVPPEVLKVTVLLPVV